MRLRLQLLLASLTTQARAPLRLNELDQLKLFYNVTSGADWSVNTNWDIGASSQCGWSDQSVHSPWPYQAPAPDPPLGPGCIYKDPCSWDTKWYGVGCVDPCYAPTDGDNCVFGRVTAIKLPKNKLAGTIPSSFFDELINITGIDLSHNSMSGTIPSQIGKIRNLRRIELTHNGFQGTIPTEISHAGYALGYTDGITHIDLSTNNLTGTIPSQIAYLESLESLDVSANAHFGFPVDGDNLGLNPGLPSEIGLLTKLQILKLDNDGFLGTIPTEIGELDKLRHFLARGNDVSNRFSGTLPTQIGKLKNVNTFAIPDNRISGTIPDQIGDMTILRRWEVQENELSGTMPDNFGGLRHLTYWDTYGNKLTGDLPPSISNVTTLEHFYIQIEHSDVIRNWRCRERIPGLGSAHTSPNVPSNDPSLKFNWYVQVAEYFMYKHTYECPNPHDVNFAFNALSGDV